MFYRKLRKILSGFEKLDTKRLFIKNLCPDDVYDMYEYSRDPIVSEYLLWSPHLNPAETEGVIEHICKRYKKGLYGDWGIYLKDTGKLIGTVGYAYIDSNVDSCEIGYVLSPRYWKCGYMTEAMTALLALTFEQLKANSAVLRIMTENSRSKRLAEKLGFRLNYTCENEISVKGVKRTIDHYVMTREDYRRLYQSYEL